MKPNICYAVGLTFLFLFSHGFSTAQTIIWSDNFNNGCASNCVASTWNGWTIQDNVGGTTGSAPNNWFVSCAEEGVAPNGCGSSCVGDPSLHIGANAAAGGDMGASFNETGATNATYRMAVSPVISTVGHSGTITLAFDFIAYGSASCTDDRLQLRLSTDGGATWPAGMQYCLTSVCCGACNGYSQGQWTTYSLALPAAFANNPNVRLGFHWVNNGNGSGYDPSAAIDDVRLTTPIALSADMIHFSAEKSGSATEISWKVANEKNFSHYELERADNGTDFEQIYSVNGSCAGSQPCTYTFRDGSHAKTVYYRLRMVDQNGSSNYSEIISLDEKVSNSTNYALISSMVVGDVLEVKISSKKKTSADFALYNIAGKVVVTEKDVAVKNGFNQNNMDVGKLPKGVYILKIYLGDEDKVISAKVIRN